MLKLKPEIEFRSLEQPHDKAYFVMRSSRLLSFFFLLLPLQTFGEVYDVSTTAELRAALASAAAAGGDNTIRLAAGTYSRQDDGGGVFRYVTTTSGNLIIRGESQSNTVLDGAGQNRVFATIVEDSTSMSMELSDLTIQNGIAADGNGGGINLDQQTSSLVITRTTFQHNTATGNGGAVGYDRSGTLTISDSTFKNNSAANGGAVCAKSWHLEDSTFENNSVTGSGGALYSCGLGDKITMGNVFDGNSASRGGVMRGACNGQHKTIGNVFSNNSASDTFGIGEMCNEWTNNLFINNSAQKLAIGYLTGTSPRFSSNVTIDNTSFNENDEYGGSALTTYGVTNNNIFVATDIGLDKRATVTNNIFLSNDTDVFALSGEDFYQISNNYIDTSRLSSDFIINGSNNVFDSIDLGFVNAEEGDYRLKSSSGLIDAGTTDSELAYITDYDYTGTTARVIGSSIDIGPYEYDGEAPPDSDGDGLNDNIDNCPSIANADQADFDLDGEGDVCDSDDDNDGTNDEDDAFPYDYSESLDTDGDGIGNNEDYDDDADGILDSFDNAPLVVNAIVVDSDNDGVIDSVDAYPNDPNKQYSGSDDPDGDGFSNDEEIDYCTNPFDKGSQPELGGLSLPMIHLITNQ